MTGWLPVLCPDCHGDDVNKHGKSDSGKQRYLCQNSDCLRRTFVLDTEQLGRKREVKQKIVDITLNGSFTLAAIEAPHAPILDAASPQSTAYLIDEIFLNSSDSFADSLSANKRTPVLALPIMAPWMTELEVAEFARRMLPQRIIPVHVGYCEADFPNDAVEVALDL